MNGGHTCGAKPGSIRNLSLGPIRARDGTGREDRHIMGDMHIVATYSGWKDFGGVMAPSTIVQTRGGWPFFEVV